MTAATDVTLGGEALSDAVPEAVVTNVVRTLAGTRRHVFVDVPGRSGSLYYPEASGDRTLTLSLHILGETFAERRDAVRRLALWAIRDERLALVVDDEPDRYELAVATEAPTIAEKVTTATVDLTFRCGPYALATVVSDEVETATSGVPFTIPFPDDTDAEPTIEVTLAGAAGTVTLEVDGRTLTNTGTFATSDAFTVSTPGYVVVGEAIGDGATADGYLDGEYDPDAVAMAGVAGLFPVLTVGGGTLEVTTDTGAGAEVRVRWRRRYR